MRPITAFIVSAVLASWATVATHATAHAFELPYEESLTAMDTEVTVRRASAQDQTQLELDHGGTVTTVYLDDTNRVRVAEMLTSAVP